MGTLGLQISDLVEASISKEFKIAVKEALLEADERALEVRGLLIKEAGHPKFLRKSSCSNCGCSLDDRTPGCRNCRMRHYARRRSNEIRAETTRREAVVEQVVVQDAPVLWGWL